jgi:hypothetical protein
MYSNDQKIKVKALSEEGKSLRQISDLTGIPKSTVSDWIQQEIELSWPMQSISLPDKTPSDMVFKGIPDEVNNVSDRNQQIPGQIKPKIEISMNEHDENKTNRTELGQYHMSPEMMEVEKLKNQQLHEREMIQLAIQRDFIELRKQEIIQREKISKDEDQKINQIIKEFLDEVTEVAQFIYDKGQNTVWDYYEIQELFDKLDHLNKNSLPVVKKNYLYIKTSPFFQFYYWIIRNCNSWIEEADEIDGLEIEFTDEEMELVRDIAPSVDTETPDQDSNEISEIRALIIRRRLRKKRRDAEAAL